MLERSQNGCQQLSCQGKILILDGVLLKLVQISAETTYFYMCVEHVEIHLHYGSL